MSEQDFRDQVEAAKYAEHIYGYSIKPLIDAKIDVFLVVDPRPVSKVVIQANVIGAMLLDLIVSAVSHANEGKEREILNDLKSGLDRAWHQRADATLTFSRSCARGGGQP